jgi:hypothetical protein
MEIDPQQESNKARLIAYYLPQFQPIPENDLWWGKGFTEWTNVSKAKPLFKGHRQPKLPGELGFYDLRLPEVREAQAQMAKEHGVEGFCYWHYWFGNGKRLLEKTIGEVLQSGKPDLPFCFAWANQTWGGLPYGDLYKRILVEQLYPGKEDFEAHFYEVLPAFLDKRYIRVHNKPVFQINSPTAIPNTKAFIDQWQELAIKNGLDGVFFVAHGLPEFEYKQYGYDSLSFTTPLHLFNRYHDTTINRLIKKTTKRSANYIFRKLFNRPALFDYNRIVDASNYDDLPRDRYFMPVAIPNWDHTPRSGVGGNVILNSSPELFLKNLENCYKLIEHRPLDEKVIFIKSWNEWAEGNFLEPEVEYGLGFLEKVKQFQNS